MASKAPIPSRHPAGIPASGGAKYVVIGVALVLVMGGAIAWKMSQKPPEPVVLTVDAAAPPPPKVMGRNPDEDVPPPPPVEDAGPPEKGTKVATTGGQATAGMCNVPKCNGSAGAELEQALQFRVKQSHRCYDNALAQDSTLRGKLTVSVRIGANGQACSAGIASNEMGSQSVGNCVSGYFRGANFPAPKGGCVDVNIPINFVPRQ